MQSEPHDRRIAFLTLSDRSGFFVYDELTFEPLRKLGWHAEEIAWDAPNIDWSHYDAVVIRSTWDYQQRPDEFMALLDSISAKRIPLFNSASLVRWNMQKSYLRELESKGIRIVPTQWLDRVDDHHAPDQFCDHWSVDQIVIKPLIGANADDTFRIPQNGGAVWQQAQSVFADQPCLVQPFIDSIGTTGEYSLFYFRGEYSHAVLKRPKDGDFRVQEEHGGSISACEPPAPLLEQGSEVIDAIPELPLYARVDYVRMDNDTWCVIEVELIEPSLYFPYDPQSPQRFATAVDQTLRRLPPAP